MAPAAEEFTVSSIPECGGIPINGSMALQLEPGISLILVRSDKGYCFSSWSRHDGGLMPEVSEAHRLRAFPDPDEAAKFFRSLIGLDAAR